jgi:hypothetical protein
MCVRYVTSTSYTNKWQYQHYSPPAASHATSAPPQHAERAASFRASAGGFLLHRPLTAATGFTSHLRSEPKNKTVNNLCISSMVHGA